MPTHYIRTVTCPLCGGTAERTNETTKHLFGSPFRTCVSCGKVYFDNKYEEPAIAIYKGSGRFETPTILRIIVGLFLTGVLIHNYFVEPILGDIPIWGLLFLVLLGPAMAIHTIFFLINTTQSKIIDKIENHPEKLTEEAQQSLERLSDQQYIDLLRSYDYDVPSFFDERIKKKLSTKEGTSEKPTTMPEAKPVTAPKEKPAVEMNNPIRYCSNCGAKLTDKDKFCSYCGKKTGF